MRDEKAVRDLWRTFEAAGAGPLAGHCAVALALLGERESVLRTCDALKRETAAEARARCAATLGVLGGPEAVAALRERLADETEAEAVRAMAAVGIGLALDTRPVDPLARLKTRIPYATTSRALYEVLQIR